jgi:UDP-N-acetylglucosamine enolpyruvyl transferase
MGTSSAQGHVTMLVAGCPDWSFVFDRVTDDRIEMGSWATELMADYW